MRVAAAVPWYWRSLSLGSLLGLSAWIALWNIFLAPVQYVPLTLELGLLLIPLLLLVKGVWRNQGKSYVYAILLSLLYVTLGFLAIGSESVYGYSLIVLSMGLYLGSFMAARVISQHNKALALQQEQLSHIEAQP